MLSTVLSGGAHSAEGRVWAQYGQRGGVMQGWGDTSTGGGLGGGKRGSLELTGLSGQVRRTYPLSLLPCFLFSFFTFFFFDVNHIFKNLH